MQIKFDLLITGCQALIEAAVLSNIRKTLAFSSVMFAKNKGSCIPWQYIVPKQETKI